MMSDGCGALPRSVMFPPDSAATLLPFQHGRARRREG